MIFLGFLVDLAQLVLVRCAVPMGPVVALGCKAVRVGLERSEEVLYPAFGEPPAMLCGNDALEQAGIDLYLKARMALVILKDGPIAIDEP